MGIFQKICIIRTLLREARLLSLRKLSYVFILLGLLFILFPKATEWNEDREQSKLLKAAELPSGKSDALWPPVLRTAMLACPLLLRKFRLVKHDKILPHPLLPLEALMNKLP